MTLEDIHTILTIQSHVVHGYVGNKAATFPLQCQGWDVDALNTVNYSNHTGYGSIQGTQVSADELKNVYEGLMKIGVSYNALLTGYVPDAASLEAVGEIGKHLKERDPSCMWLLDPVMGDEGQLYVNKNVIPIYQKILTSGGVDVITPNQFEAELLVGYDINSKDSLKTALQDLHTKFKVQNVVISSIRFESEEFDQSKLFIVTSRVVRDETFDSLFEIPFIESYFTGVGDLFSALLIDRVYKFCSQNNRDSKDLLNESVNEVLTVMAHVLRVTSKAAERRLGKSVKSKMGSAETMKECELRLIESREFYSSKEKKFNSVVI